MKNKRGKLKKFSSNFSKKNRRGLSTVVTTLIIILLVLVAVSIVWVVIRNVIETGIEEISIGKFTLNLEITDVVVNTGNVDVKIKRNAGIGELSGIKFIVSDGIETQVFEENTTIQELGQATFTLNYIGLVKEVSIAPILKSGSGKESIGSEFDKFEFSNKKIIENLGAVSWWGFEGNANDKIGNNHGTLNGNVDCNVVGKYGKACSFDGVDDSIRIPSSIITSSNQVSFGFWINMSNQISNWKRILSDQTNGINLYFASTGTDGLYGEIGNSVSGWIMQAPDLTDQIWHHITLVANSDDGSITSYFDGVLQSTQSSGFSEITLDDLYIGQYYSSIYYLNGTIDEVMIFNKSLSEEEVEALYNLDLS